MTSMPKQGRWFTSSEVKPEEKTSFKDSLDYFTQHFNFDVFATPQVVVAFALGSLSTVGAVALQSRYFKRIPTSEWVHPRLIAKRKWIKGIVTSVGDGDGFRLYHTPGLFWRWPLKLRKVPTNAKELKDETIHIRLCFRAGVDAPEAAHFGKQAQPYSAEALVWLKKEVEGKRLWVQLIRRDQYGRIVSIPMRPPRFPFFKAPASRCVSISMLSAGYATTYEQSGAEYGRWGKEQFLQYEEAARAARRGMWASTVALETPAEYKKRHREGTTPSGTSNNESRASSIGRKKSRSWTDVLVFWR
ncbi:SNase-domain-containing protein [Ramaria rubella]|nr:SNase-domain-containing protein [Ramaria rubella]